MQVRVYFSKHDWMCRASRCISVNQCFIADKLEPFCEQLATIYHCIKIHVVLEAKLTLVQILCSSSPSRPK